MHEVQVTIANRDDAHGVAELWAAGSVIGFTRIVEGDLALSIDPRGRGLLVSVNALIGALAAASRRFFAAHPRDPLDGVIAPETTRPRQLVTREQSP
jgi:hypothetical protein